MAASDVDGCEVVASPAVRLVDNEQLGEVEAGRVLSASSISRARITGSRSATSFLPLRIAFSSRHAGGAVERAARVEAEQHADAARRGLWPHVGPERVLAAWPAR